MSVLLGLFSVVLVVGLLLVAFAKADAARLAQTLRLSGPLALGAVGGGLMLVGRAGIGGLHAVRGVRLVHRRPRPPQRGQDAGPALDGAYRGARDGTRSRYRAASKGWCWPAAIEGRSLGAMGEAELQHRCSRISGDAESRQLLETYLDGRFPVWRKNTRANRGERLGVAPGSGAMTKEEAYKVLGLEAGAAAADVRKAHRRLMQRLHPDVGGTSFWRRASTKPRTSCSPITTRSPSTQKISGDCFGSPSSLLDRRSSRCSSSSSAPQAFQAAVLEPKPPNRAR